MEKAKRLPTEVTKEQLAQIIGNINDEHREKTRKEDFEKTGVRPWIRSDPWHEMNRAEGPDLINPDSWDFTEKSRWMLMYLRSKQNTELHAKTVSVEGKNGLEAYR